MKTLSRFRRPKPKGIITENRYKLLRRINNREALRSGICASTTMSFGLGFLIILVFLVKLWIACSAFEFQRAGSLMVLYGIWAYILVPITWSNAGKAWFNVDRTKLALAHLKQPEGGFGSWVALLKRITLHRKGERKLLIGFFKVIELVFVSFGTLIWGYGDLFVEKYCVIAVI